MDDALAGELLKKEQILDKILGIVAAQNEAIKNNETEKIFSFDSEKRLFMERLSETDNSIKPFILKNNRYPETIADKVKTINLLLNKLIAIEKENEKLLSDMEVSASGKHIEAYKRAVK